MQYFQLAAEKEICSVWLYFYSWELVWEHNWLFHTCEIYLNDSWGICNLTNNWKYCCRVAGKARKSFCIPEEVLRAQYTFSPRGGHGQGLEQYWDSDVHISFLGCATLRAERGCLIAWGFCGMVLSGRTRGTGHSVFLSCFHVPDTDERSNPFPGSSLTFYFSPSFSTHPNSLPPASYQTSPREMTVAEAKLSFGMDQPCPPWWLINISRS